MDAVVDERTLREIYLTGFEIAVKEGHAKAIMSSYNQINGIYANEDKHLLTDILRKEWGFDGIVVTDWGGSNDHVKGVAAGSNLEMPSCGYDSAREVIAAFSSIVIFSTNFCCFITVFHPTFILIQRRREQCSQSGASDICTSDEKCLQKCHVYSCKQLGL